MTADMILTLVLTGGFSFTLFTFGSGLGFEMRKSSVVTRICTAAVMIQR